MASKNENVTACKKPTGRVGGTNAPVYAAKSATPNKSINQGSNIPERALGRKKR
jgi:hypothetical protein